MLEDRLEAVERELIRLNKTLQDLITIYVDSQAGNLLANIPKADHYLPEFIKQRDAVMKKRGKQTITTLRETVDFAVQVLGVHTVELVLNNYTGAGGEGCRSLSEVMAEDYNSLHAELIERLPDDL